MNDKEYIPYSHPRWTEIPSPVSVGHTELTEKEKEEAQKEMDELIRETEEIWKTENR